MTEQFQVGGIYRTRGGDRVRVTLVVFGPDLVAYPVTGMFLNGGAAGRNGVWTLGGQWTKGCEAFWDLLPGALPEPAAAGAAVKPTVEALQASAVDLIRRMASLPSAQTL